MSSGETILVIEDEDIIRKFICTALGSAGYQTLPAASGEEGKSLFLSHCPDLVLLDLGLPDLDGMEVLAAIRDWSQAPVIVVSARSREAEKVAALLGGADDYLTKPFGVPELVARIKSSLRRAGQQNRPTGSQVLQVRELCIDTEKHQVTLAGEAVHFTQIEYKLLVLLASHVGKVLTYDQLLRQVWGAYSCDDNRILRVNMANIRRKLHEDPSAPLYIMTELGVGYRMLEE